MIHVYNLSINKSSIFLYFMSDIEVDEKRIKWGMEGALLFIGTYSN